MLERYITAPDGMEWVVGRKFLFGAPRYIGFRFGRDKRAFAPPRIRRVPAGSMPNTPALPTEPPEGAVTRTQRADWSADSSRDPARRKGRYRPSSGVIWVPSFRSGSSWSGGSGSGWSGGSGGAISSSGGSRISSSGGSRSSSSGGSRGGGKGAAGGAVGAAGFLLKFLKFALIAILVVAAIVLTIFVLIPALIFLMWALFVGLTIAWYTVTKRPWVVEAREHRDAPRVLGWTVVGWDESKLVIDQVADAIANGVPPAPQGALPVSVLTRSIGERTPHPANTSWPPTVS